MPLAATTSTLFGAEPRGPARVARRPAVVQHRGVEPGERMLLPCEGGPSISRLVRFPPPLEIEERGGQYVLVDDGPPATWRYDFVPA